MKAYNLLREAEVILYDRLIDDRIFDFFSEKAVLVDVGKVKGVGSKYAEQENINKLLVDYAKQYSTVVRLKGGDPFLFGRGGEEAIALREEQIDFELVPGISSCLAAPLSAGIPVTHRGIARGVIVMTGHEIDEEVLYHAVKTSMTIVILMGVANKEQLCSQLQAAGLSPDTKVAVCENSSLITEVSRRLCLADLAIAEVKSPAVFVIGEVTGLELKRLSPNAEKPLYGKVVAVTRARHQSEGLISLLQKKGAKVLCAPLIEIVPLDNLEKTLENYIGNISFYHWIIFTSSNAVEYFLAHLPDVRMLKDVKIAAVGFETAKRLGAKGIVADLLPVEFSAGAIVEEFAKLSASVGQKVLIPRSKIATSGIVETLSGMGYEVDTVDVYDTIQRPLSEAAVSMIKYADIVTFTSPSTVRSYMNQLGKESLSFAASIGKETTNALMSYGVVNFIQAAKPTMADLTDAIVRHFS
jgi:uroporphyrinogen III methyltransferase/synthase